MTVTASKLTKIEILCGDERIPVGDKLALVVKHTPENAPIPQIRWSSDDEGVATVDKNGVVTGVSRGSANITAEYSFIDCSGFTGSLGIGTGVTTIGSGAFVRCKNLHNTVAICPNVVEIEAKAFYSTPIDTIVGYDDSYAEKYAKENGYRFISI